eukprot:EC121274.1.p1 GENE.EC121274.1~~EC121274.1.p1  ORF type:complete len:173 (+),score=15.76 EC121274.1:46-564(+)
MDTSNPQTTSSLEGFDWTALKKEFSAEKVFAHLRPWPEFFSNFDIPSTDPVNRVIANLYYLQYNYYILCLFCFVIAMVTRPCFFLALIGLGFAWLYFLKKKDEVIIVRQQELTMQQKYAAMVFGTAVVLVVTKALIVAVWTLLLAIAACIVHAGVRDVSSGRFKREEEGESV